MKYLVVLLALFTLAACATTQSTPPTADGTGGTTESKKIEAPVEPEPECD